MFYLKNVKGEILKLNNESWDKVFAQFGSPMYVDCNLITLAVLISNNIHFYKNETPAGMKEDNWFFIAMKDKADQSAWNLAKLVKKHAYSAKMELVIDIDESKVDIHKSIEANFHAKLHGPPLLATPNLQPLLELAQGLMEYAAKEAHSDVAKEYRRNIYQQTIKSFYGDAGNNFIDQMIDEG